MANNGVFRAILSAAGDSGQRAALRYLPRPTLRPPGNVPYVVDNLWEWTRPDGYPNRRLSAFANPRPDLALAALNGPGVAYRVAFLGTPVVAQLVAHSADADVRDAKFHRDCKDLRKCLGRLLGEEWFGQPLNRKQDVAALWAPCLSKEEVEALFEQSDLLWAGRDEIREAVRYWDDVVLVDDLEHLPDPQGEIVFEYPDGYELVAIE